MHDDVVFLGELAESIERGVRKVVRAKIESHDDCKNA